MGIKKFYSNNNLTYCVESSIHLNAGKKHIHLLSQGNGIVSAHIQMVASNQAKAYLPEDLTLPFTEIMSTSCSIIIQT